VRSIRFPRHSRSRCRCRFRPVAVTYTAPGGQRIEFPAARAAGIAELEVQAAVIMKKSDLVSVISLGNPPGRTDDGGCAADEVEIAAEVEPWAAGGVDVSLDDIPAGCGRVLFAPCGQAAMHAIVPRR